MINPDKDAIFKLQSKHKFLLYSDSFHENLICTHCQNLLIDPCLTPCGCQYCFKCINEILSNGGKFCQGGYPKCGKKTIVAETDVFRNERLYHRICRAKVLCPNRYCYLAIPLDQMENHLQTCSSEIRKCPYVKMGCTDGDLLEREILEHLHTETNKHNEMLISSFHNLKNENADLKERCRLNQLEIEALKENRCLKQKEIEELRGEFLVMGVEMRNKEVRITHLEDVVAHNEARLVRLENVARSNKKAEIIPGKEMDTKTIQKVDSKILNFQNDLAVLQQTVKAMQGDLDCRISFTIKQFQRKKTSQSVIISPGFYSWTNGYNIRLEIRPGGKGATKGTHMSVYFGINKGNYDDLLPWPFKNTVNVMIMNQITGVVHVKKGFKYSCTDKRLWHLFHKPKDANNTACGIMSFISHLELENTDGLIVDDSIVFSCTVS